jgi:hypothetical protein
MRTVALLTDISRVACTPGVVTRAELSQPTGTSSRPGPAGRPGCPAGPAGNRARRPPNKLPKPRPAGSAPTREDAERLPRRRGRDRDELRADLQRGTLASPYSGATRTPDRTFEGDASGNQTVV